MWHPKDGHPQRSAAGLFLEIRLWRDGPASRNFPHVRFFSADPTPLPGTRWVPRPFRAMRKDMPACLISKE